LLNIKQNDERIATPAYRQAGNNRRCIGVIIACAQIFLIIFINPANHSSKYFKIKKVQEWDAGLPAGRQQQTLHRRNYRLRPNFPYNLY
jgi:hypothetical protein